MERLDSGRTKLGSVIRGYYASLTPSEQRVANYVLEHLPNVIRMTLAEVAQESGVSDATVLRFCRSLGYQRWLEFKIDLTQSLPSPSEQLLDEVDEKDSSGMLAKKIFNCSIQALEDTSAVLKEADLNRALDMISRAQKILIVGVGTSGPIAHEMYNRFFRLGLNCHVQTDSYLQMMETALLSSNDLLIVVSQTGDSTDPIRTAAHAKSQGCPVVVITGNSGSKLTELADVILLSVSHETRIESMSSRIAQYALAHALFVGLMMRNISDAVAKDQLIWGAMMDRPSFQDQN